MASSLVKRMASSLLRPRLVTSSSHLYYTKVFQYGQYDSQDECILKSDDRYGSVVQGWRAVEDDKALYLQRIMTIDNNESAKESVPNKECMSEIHKKVIPKKMLNNGSLEDLEIIQEEDTHPSLDTSLNHEEGDQEINEPQSDINPIRKSTRTCRLIDRLCLYVDTEEHELGDLDNKVWELVDLPPNGKTVGHKWLFKKKTYMDGAVHTYKARLVAKGFTQTSGIDYEETLSLVADIRAIRILIAIAAFYDYEIWRMDVKTAFLNRYLNEEGASTPAKIQCMQNIPYASAVGSIMYVVRCTRPDVAFAQNITSRFQQNPGDKHWTTIKNILKYLCNTRDMFLVYEGDMKRELKVSCYTDAGYLTDVDDMKSQTGYVFVLNRGVVDWKSTKQSIFATSSTDVEYIAVFDASKEAV
ncbi:putative retrotransposon protein [Tanacetum coccineum]